MWEELRRGQPQGLLYERRGVVEGRERAPLRGISLAEVVTEYRRRCAGRGDITAADRQHLRDAVFHEAGALTYDTSRASSRRWPAACAGRLRRR